MLPKRERVEFVGSLGHPLAGRVDRPPGEPRAWVLMAHCFTCGKDLKGMHWIARALVDRRIAVLRFDFTGLGDSGGDFADTSFTSNVADLVAAADWLRAAHGAPGLLVGHSLGGTAALVAAARIPEVRAVVTIAAPADTGHMRAFLARQTADLAPDATAEVDVMGRAVRIRGRMIADLERHDVTAAIAALGRPLLVLHSPEDAVVGIAEARRIFEAARHPKSFVALDGADHLLVEREADARFVAELLAAWAGRYAAAAG